LRQRRSDRRYERIDEGADRNADGLVGRPRIDADKVVDELIDQRPGGATGLGGTSGGRTGLGGVSVPT